MLEWFFISFIDIVMNGLHETSQRRNNMQHEHIIGAKQFNREHLEELFEIAREMERIVESGGSNRYQNKVMTTLFFEPSTRTRLSFESAMSRLGGKVIGTENAAMFSSTIKGETLEDTIRVVSAYSDVIVMRHTEIGAAQRAAKVATVPIINAGMEQVSILHKLCWIYTPFKKKLAALMIYILL